MLRFASIARVVSLAIVLGFAGSLWQVAAQPATPFPAVTPLPEGTTTYVDPAGRFTLPLPTGWTAATTGDIGVLTSPEGGITVYALVIPGTDVPDALDMAWRVVDPDFALTAGEPTEVPGMVGLRPFTLVEYQGAPEGLTVQAVGFAEGGTVYALLVWAEREEAVRRQSQMQTAALGIEIAGVEEVSLLGVAPRKLTPAALAEVDAFVGATLEKFGIPGAAYAVVQDGQIVHSAGFGVTELGGNQPFTPETMLPAASATKPMTTTYMATVVDDGAMRWETPVVDILPSFAVADAAVTPTMTMRDLVCACAGVPKRDFELGFESEGMTAADVIASLRDFTFYTSIGEAYQYSNQMVAAGGYITALAAGGSLDTVHDDYVTDMEQRIFGPIGMEDTTFSRQEATEREHFAKPHALALDGSVTAFPLERDANVSVVAPAGGAWTTVEDLGRFAITQLQLGVAPDGTPVVSADNLAATWAPRVQMAPGVSYGLGWIVTDYKQQPLLFHDGGTLGYNAEVAFLPEAGLGVAIVLNQSNMLPFAEAVRNRVFEAAFDQPPSGDAVVAFAVEQQRQLLANLAGMAEPIDEQEVAPFLGLWEHPALGMVSLTLEDGRLLADAGEIASELVAAKDGATGESFFLTATPPFVGIRVSLRIDGGSRTVLVHDPASTEAYVFVPDAEGESPSATPAA